MSFLLRFVDLFTQALIMAIFVRAILSWFPISQGNPLVAIVYQITEPVLAPLRRIIPRFGMMDISPMVAMLILQFVVPLIVRQVL